MKGKADCPHCMGSSFISIAQRYEMQRGENGRPMRVPIGDPEIVPPDMPPMYHNEKWPYPQWSIAAQLCVCVATQMAQDKLSKTASQDGVPTDRDQFTLEDFKGYPVAYKLSKQFIERQQVTGKDGLRFGLLYVGGTGTGKTTIAYVDYKELLHKGIAAAWFDYTLFIQDHQKSYDPDYTGDKDVLERAKHAPLLVLDDIGEKPPQVALPGMADYDPMEGVKPARENRIEIMYTLVAHREAKKLPTILTTNLTIKQLYRHFGDRLMSRILGLCEGVLMNSDVDLRTGKARTG